jgi:selenocysteine lyase/cysteine desulfurase
MIVNQRHLFDLPDDITFLDMAARSPLPNAVHASGVSGLARKYHPWEIDLALPPAEAEAIRGLFAGLIGASADDIAIVNATAYAAATAAANLPIGAGQKIVVIEDQFPSNLLAWRHLATERGAALRTVMRPTDGDWTSAVLDALDADTAIVPLPPCHWSDGSRLDLAAIGARCRELGAAFVIDGTQAIGAMPFDVGELQPDFVLCSAYKWLFCPYTLAFLYAAPHRQDGTPLEFHNWNHAGAGSTSPEFHNAYNKGARRYDMGEVNNLINLPMALTALEMLTEWTPAAIQETIAPLTAATAAAARERGWSVPPDAHRVGHYIGMTPPKPLPDDIIPRLKAARVFISERGSGLRVSPHVFNDADDIARLFDAIDKVLA